VKAAYTKCVRAVWAADGGQRVSAPPPTRVPWDALYPEVLYEVCERKTTDFRPPKVPPASTLI